MQSDFSTRAPMEERSAHDRFIESERALNALNHVGTPIAHATMRDVLGYAPVNRKDRRKAAKLLRGKK